MVPSTNGTLIATGAVTEFVWDHRNGLVGVLEKASASAAVNRQTTYAYDVFDRKTLHRFDSDGVHGSNRDDLWVNDGAHPILQYRDSDGAGTTQPYRLANRYLHGDIVDQILADEQYASGTGPVLSGTVVSTTPGTTFWTVADHLGSVRDLVDNNGITRQHVVYDSFGRRLSEVDRNAAGTIIASTDVAAVDTIFGYTGREWDKDTSLQYNRARWYDPATGRWLSQDPIGFEAGDANLYRYVGNGVTTKTDPSGLVLIVIDGTSSKQWHSHPDSWGPGGRKSHSYQFYSDYETNPGEHKHFFHGPLFYMTAPDCHSIYNSARKAIDDAIASGDDGEINIVGHSRGGAIAIELARYLQSRGYRVNFLGLYDAVDSTPFFGVDGMIPRNVDSSAHAISNPALGSRWYFNRLDDGAENQFGMKRCSEAVFWATHAAIGGAPWMGGKPTGTSRSVDEDVSKIVDEWMRQEARQAGIKFK